MAAALSRGAGIVMRQAPAIVACALIAATLGGCGRPESLVHRPVDVAVSELVVSASPAWSALVADLDADGVDELVLAGHRGAEGPGYCRLDGSARCRWQPFLGPAADRHHCTDGDVDDDGDLDLYCTAGADRGAGLGSNELWRQVGPMAFERAVDALGAGEASSRGRLATFFDFNRDAWPDLVTTAWGARSDGADNRSKIWINEQGHFRALDTALPPAFGARCLTVADVNADGFDDIIGCPAEAGLTVLLNAGGTGFTEVPIAVADDWYWDVRFTSGRADEPWLLVATGGVRGAMFIEIAGVTGGLVSMDRRRLACAQASIDDDEDIYCGRLLLADVDGDGHVDLLVSRRRGWRHEDVRGDAPDLLIYGPAFREFTDLPIATEGAGDRLIPSRIGILQVNAGEDWPGSVQLLQFPQAPPAETAAAR